MYNTQSQSFGRNIQYKSVRLGNNYKVQIYVFLIYKKEFNCNLLYYTYDSQWSPLLMPLLSSLIQKIKCRIYYTTYTLEDCKKTGSLFLKHTETYKSLRMHK